MMKMKHQANQLMVNNVIHFTDINDEHTSGHIKEDKKFRSFN